MQERPGRTPATFDIPYRGLWPSPVRYDGSLEVVPDGATARWPMPSGTAVFR